MRASANPNNVESFMSLLPLQRSYRVFFVIFSWYSSAKASSDLYLISSKMIFSTLLPKASRCFLWLRWSFLVANSDSLWCVDDTESIFFLGLKSASMTPDDSLLSYRGDFNHFYAKCLFFVYFQGVNLWF